jgi:hypothetical protein
MLVRDCVRMILAGLVAAPFGFVDWLATPNGTRAKRIGALHGIGTSSCRCYAASWLTRMNAAAGVVDVPAAASRRSPDGWGATSSIACRWCGRGHTPRCAAHSARVVFVRTACRSNRPHRL